MHNEGAGSCEREQLRHISWRIVVAYQNTVKLRGLFVACMMARGVHPVSPHLWELVEPAGIKRDINVRIRTWFDILNLSIYIKRYFIPVSPLRVIKFLQ